MFIRRIFRHVFMAEANAGEGGGAGGGTSPAGAGTGASAGGVEGGQAGAGGAGAGASAAGTGGSVLAGASGTEGGQQGQAVAIPEKYQVRKEDGTLDIEASSLKLAEAYGHLEKRFGAGDVPPKAAEDYQVTVPDAMKEHWNPDEDQLYQDFRKEAHAKGMTQAQFDFVMERYFNLAPQLVNGSRQLSNEDCIAELRQEWKSEEQFNAELGKSFKALQAYAGSDAEALMNEYGNDPRVIRLLARVGAEMAEDSSINPGSVLPAGQSVEAMMSSEAYTNPKHPDHARVSKQVQDYWAKKAEKDAKSGAMPLL